MTDYKENLNGLSSKEAKKLQDEYGKNELVQQKKHNFIRKVLHIICEPMFLLLIFAAVIYFILGEPRDGAIMLVFVIGMISINVTQEWKTDKTLKALKDLTAPRIMVIRDGEKQVIASIDLVPGDLMMIYEGVKIPADGRIIRCNDLCVDESSLTGEALGVWKVDTANLISTDDYWRRDYCYAGTMVMQGTATVLVDKIGTNTEYGQIGVDVAFAPEEDTPLKLQTAKLVKVCAIIAALQFVMVGIFTYFNIPDHSFGPRIIESILSGITLAMAMIPEEFPVILTVFLSIGALRIAKKQSLVRKLPAVETLGAVSVLCVDKTGTITLNQMSVQEIWAFHGDNKELITVMGLGCEIDAYDPMEKAMLDFCNLQGISKEILFQGKLIREYAFTNEVKMMGHVWSIQNEILIAAKGSPEGILALCNLDLESRELIEHNIDAMSQQGLRVIAIARMNPGKEEEIPEVITDCSFKFLGLIGLCDPPRESIKKDIEICTRAGIRVVMITGDNGITAASIAKKIGMANSDSIITGGVINTLSDEELRQKVKIVSIFSRVVPEHKMRIVKALKENGEIVAMTGDGVNDAPALKYADIGIAMGKRGSEVARDAADIILMDDNFTTIVETVKDGRRIYDNIKKAVGYVFTIHIPIALASLLAPLLGISPSAVFLLPLHIVLLELIIDPTCSIVLERQPAEDDIMDRKPRNPKEKLLSPALFIKSVIQGLVIFIASFGAYYTLLDNNQENAPTARALGLVIIMISNLFLVQVNSSNHDYAVSSIRRLMKDKLMWGVNIITISGILLILYSPLANILKLKPLSALQFISAILVAACAVFWYELIKLIKNVKGKVNVIKYCEKDES